MGNVQVLWVLYFVYMSTITGDKNFFFNMEMNKMFGASVISTKSARSARECTMLCMDSSECRGCNWRQTDGLCQLIGAYVDFVDAPGYKAYTRELLL